jgi:hypothetical protein
MTDFTEKLRLKEKAEEDLFFARQDQALIEALRARRKAWPTAIRSGGQTGVDRAALDAALALAQRGGWQVAGWCPRGRLAEDGVIDGRYPLTETPSADPAQRTEWNVRDADGTLIVHRGEMDAGTALTREVAERLGKPVLLLNAADAAAIPSGEQMAGWLREHGVAVLNIAGPRESESPGIGRQARALLGELLEALIASRTGGGAGP